MDNVIPGVPTQLDIIESSPGYDVSGAPRALRTELRAQSSRNEAGSQSSGWARIQGAFDTMNYGALSLDASVRLYEHDSHRLGGTGLSFSLYQADMPFADGWTASQAAGVIQTLGPRLANQQAAFFLPTRLVQGASSEWRDAAKGLTLQLSGGETGSFSSVGQGSFYGSGDHVVAVGIQVQGGTDVASSLLPAGWSYAGLASRASGGKSSVIPGFGVRIAEPGDDGLWQAVRWESANASIQGNLLAVHPLSTSGSDKALQRGLWLDGTWQDGLTSHRWGLQRLDPDLTWQGSSIGGNAQGGYYRWSQAGLRTQVDLQLSNTTPVDTQAGQLPLRQAGIAVRRYVDQQLGVGGTAQFSRTNVSSLQLSGYGELHRPWADVRLQSGVELLGDGTVSAVRLSGDQSWVLPVGQRLTSSLAWNSTRSTGTTGSATGPFTNSVEVALAGGADLAERFSADLSARAVQPLSDGLARVFNVSATGQWRWAPGWSLSATLGWSHAASYTATPTNSFVPSLPSAFTSTVFPATSSRDLWLTLRYEFQAGAAAMPLGAGAHAGGGGADLLGVVYLDDNGNGRRDAYEAPAANVTVVLDGHYTTRTDAQGRFTFPFVASGPHTVAVAADTLPLPWTVGTEPVRVEVAPRTPTRVEIGATRDRLGAQ